MPTSKKSSMKAAPSKEDLEQLYFQEGLSMRAIAAKLGVNKVTIERKMKKFGITRRTNVCGWLKATQNRSIELIPGMKWCHRCKLHLPLTSFKGSVQKRTSYCSKCYSVYDRERGVALRLKAVQYLGGVCKNCGFTQHAAFDFHHRIPAEKDVSWDKLRKRGWKRIVVELDKCDLLCANCHRIHHSETT